MKKDSKLEGTINLILKILWIVEKVLGLIAKYFFRFSNLSPKSM